MAYAVVALVTLVVKQTWCKQGHLSCCVQSVLVSFGDVQISRLNVWLREHLSVHYGDCYSSLLHRYKVSWRRNSLVSNPSSQTLIATSMASVFHSALWNNYYKKDNYYLTNPNHELSNRIRPDFTQHMHSCHSTQPIT